jgi:protein phosphatase
MKISVPALSLVVLIGSSGSGKSTFARRHFLPTEIISSDHCRALIADDENDQSATQAAFEIVHAIADRRLSAGRLAVIDATSVEPESRASLIALAKRQHVFAVAIVFDVPTAACIARNERRTDRRLPAGVIQRQQSAMRRSMSKLNDEGFRYVYRLSGDALSGEIGGAGGATLERSGLWTDRRDDHGPFDIIGDIHGCAQELESLLDALGYLPADPASGAGRRHPDGRRAVFVGDLVDRSPDAPGVLRRVMEMTASGAALCAPGNHDVRLVRRLAGRDVKLTHGLKETM